MKCLNCGDWFEIVYNNIPGLTVDYCPFCGIELAEGGWEDEDGEHLGYATEKGESEDEDIQRGYAKGWGL